MSIACNLEAKVEFASIEGDSTFALGSHALLFSDLFLALIFPINCRFNKQGQCSELHRNHVTYHIQIGKRSEGNAALAEALSVLWKYDFRETDKTEKLTQAELDCYNFTLANIEYDAKTPIYTVKLPWIGGKPPILPNTYRVAKFRFQAMERQLKQRMESNPKTLNPNKWIP